nr:protein seele isoform X2 [Ipomoea batatas]
MAKASLISLAILLVSVVPFVYSIEDKCGACTAVAEELEHGLMTEKPRNHLDMRHRLDSKGQREGKLIDYRVSDLRVVELLDELCEKMQDYTLEKVDSGTKVWTKVNDWDKLKTSKNHYFICHHLGIKFSYIWYLYFLLTADFIFTF